MAPISTQDLYKTQSIDTVALEPSIREGEILYKGILRPNVAVPIPRNPPKMLVAPSISGNFRIPSELTCNPGVWDGSPSPKYRYQWKSNGNDIPGAVNSIWLSTQTYEFTEITCEVTAYNILGSIEADSSNSIRIEPVYPARIEDYGIIIPGGISTKGHQKIPSIHFNYIQRTSSINFESIFGIHTIGLMVHSTKENQQIQGTDIYQSLGRSFAGVQTNMNIDIIQSLNQVYPGNQVHFIMDTLILDGITNLKTILLKNTQNPYAESGITGWSIDSGSLNRHNSNPNYFRLFPDSTSIQGSSAIAYQEITFESDEISTFQTENYELMMDVWVRSQSDNDNTNQIKFYVTFYDNNNDIISTVNGTTRANNSWNLVRDNFGVIPTNAVKIRLHANGTQQITSNNNGNVYFTGTLLYMQEVA